MKRLIRYLMIFLCLLLFVADILCWVYFFVIYINETHLGHSDQIKIMVFLSLILITIIPILLVILLRKRSNRIDRIANIIKKSNPLPIQYNKIIDFRFSSKMDYNDYKRLNLEVVLKDLILILGAIYLLIMIILLIITESFIISIVYILVGVLLIFVIIYVLLMQKIRHYYNSNNSLKHTTSFHITNEFLEVVNNNSTTTYSWSKFYKIKETKSFILLYQDRIVFNCFDKRLFKQEDLVEFKSFLMSLDAEKYLFEDKM